MTPEQIAQINATRNAQVDKGLNPYAGGGATNLSNSAGLGGGPVTITADDLKGNVAPVALPNAKPTGTNLNNLNTASTNVLTATNETTDLQTTLDKDATAKKNIFDQGKEALSGVYDKIFNVQNSKQKLEDEQGISAKTEAVNKATKDLDEMNRRERVEVEKIYNEPGVSKAVADQRAAQVSRSFAFERADRALIQSGANRDLATAQSIVDHKIELQLEPLKTQLDFLKTTYADNRADMSESRDKAFQLKIKTIEQKYDEEKATKTAIGNLQLEALKNGVKIPASVLGQLNGAGSIVEAASILQKNGISLQDPVERAYKQAQTAKLFAEIRETDNPDPSGTMAYAQQYATTGMIPTGLPKGTFGLVAQVAKELPKSNGTLVSKTTGIVPPSSELGTERKDALISLYNAVQKADDLKKQFANITPGIIGGTLGKITGSKAQQDYTAARDLTLKELQYALSGKAITQQEFDYFEGLLPTRFNNSLFVGVNGDDKIDSFKNNISTTLNNKLDGYGASIYGYSKVKVGDQQYTVGDIISNDGKTGYRVNADGSLTQVQ